MREGGRNRGAMRRRPVLGGLLVAPPTMKRRFGVFAVVMVLLASVAGQAVRTAEPAAALNAVNLLFSKPGDPARYGANELVNIEAGNINYISDCSTDHLKPGIRDYFQPFADLYIVPAGSHLTNNAKLVDAYGAPNSVFGGGGGSFLNEPLGVTFPQGRISAGVYGVVVDECQNGVFDTGEDSFIDNAFQVTVQQDVPPLSPDAVAFQTLKTRAQTLDSGMTAIEELLKVKAIIEKAQQIQELATAAMSPDAFSAFVIDQAVAAIQENSAYNKAKTFLQTAVTDSITQHVTRLRRLAADPPDASFQQMVLPATAGVHADDSTIGFAQGFNAYMGEMDTLSALTGGIVDAVEKYQGADAAGNAQWALRHARTAEELAGLYQAEVPRAQAATDAMKASLAAFVSSPGQSEYDFANTIRAVNSTMDNMVNYGYATNTRVANSGNDQATAEPIVEDYRQAVNGALPDTTTTWAAQFDTAQQGIADFAAALPDFSSLVSGLESQLSSTLGAGDRDPAVGIQVTGTPVAGGDVTLGVTGAPAGSVVSWDLNGDGDPAEADGSTTTWTVPGDALAGAPLVVNALVVAPDGSRDTATTIVDVASGGNQAPQLDALDRNLPRAGPRRFHQLPGERHRPRWGSVDLPVAGGRRRAARPGGADVHVVHHPGPVRWLDGRGRGQRRPGAHPHLVVRPHRHPRCRPRRLAGLTGTGLHGRA